MFGNNILPSAVKRILNHKLLLNVELGDTGIVETQPPLMIVCEPVEITPPDIIIELVHSLEQFEIHYVDATESVASDECCKAEEICINIRKCPKDTTVRPQTRKPSSTPVSTVPRLSSRSYRAREREERPSIKFSTCTALYTPARPGQEWARYGPREPLGTNNNKWNKTEFGKIKYYPRSVC